MPSYTTGGANSLFVRTFLAFLLFLSSCDRVPTPRETGPSPFSVEFRIGDASDTRATGITASGERQVNRWTLCVYRLSDGQLAAAGTSSSSASIARTLPAGAYRAVALVNAPVSGPGWFDPSAFLTGDGPEEQTAYLSDNVSGSLEMYGSENFFLETAPASVAIPVMRLVSKVVLRKVTLRLSDAALAAYPFTLDAVYLDNVPSRTMWGRDPLFDELGTARSLWYNAMGWHATGSCSSPACPDALLGDRSVGVTIAQGSSHTADYTYYTVPNATAASQDTRSEIWARRATRLVIEARIGQQTQYYVASLPEMVRNHS